MKVLIAPLITRARCDAGYHLTENLAALLQENGITCAVSADSANHFQHVSLYPCARPRRPLLNFQADNRAHEEWLYSGGFLSRKHLLEDFRLLEDAVRRFQPDLIISIDRPAAVMAAMKKHLPCWEVVFPAMYRNAFFPSHCMHGLNAVLSEKHMMQELDLQYFYAHADRRIGFGPMETAPFPDGNGISRLGSMALFRKKETRTNRVCIYLSAVNRSTSALRRMVESAFLGAPYYVYVSIPGVAPMKDGNLHYIRYPDASLISGASAVIHDGNDFYFNQAILHGVPQMIIADHSYQRNFNALAAARCHFGSYIFEEDLSMASLYEGYRALMADDAYYENTQVMRRKMMDCGDIRQLVDFLYIDLIDAGK